jgi:hypothetical protein
MSPVRSVKGRETGQVIVLMALLIPVIFAIGSTVMAVGNWYVLKRHLQTQVDSAVLSAGQQFAQCARDTTAANINIRDVALGYAGDTLRQGRVNPAAPLAAPANLQLEQPSDVRVVLNSSQYWTPANGYLPGTNGYGLDQTIATPGDPCSTRYLDAKATDEDAPMLWGLIPAAPDLKTKARVEIRQAETFAGPGLLPFFVLETRPRGVFALFVNENNQTIFDTQRLTLSDNASTPWVEWVTETGSQQQVTFDGLNVNTGIVILVSSDDPSPNLGGTLAQVCGQSPVNRKLACYGTGSAGLSFIHGYSGGFTGTIGSPQVRQVELTDFGCPATDLSAPYFTLTGGVGCSALVSAVLDFGVSGDPTVHPHCARAPGYTWTAGGIGGSLGTWTRTISLPTGSGRQNVSISGTSGPRNGTQCGNPNQQPHNWGFNKISAAYVADSASGPVEYLELSATAPASNPYSIETTLTHTYTTTVGLSKPLENMDWDDDPILLRDTSGPSQYQTWDCDPGNTREEFINGCRTPYSLNYDDHDGDGDKEWRDITCGTARPTPPPDCVWTDQGMSVGQFRDGVVARWRSNTNPALGQVPCYANNWPENAGEAQDFFDNVRYRDDPRYVTLLVTREYWPGPGRELIPVKFWAGFYVTGWTHHHVQAPACPDNDPPPSGASTNASLWGYYVNQVVVSSPDVEPGDPLCAFGNDPGTCVAVLVE